MFQKKIDDFFSGMPNVLGIADDILNADYDEQGKNQDEILDQVIYADRQTSFVK